MELQFHGKSSLSDTLRVDGDDFTAPASHQEDPVQTLKENLQELHYSSLKDTVFVSSSVTGWSGHVEQNQVGSLRLVDHHLVQLHSRVSYDHVGVALAVAVALREQLLLGPGHVNPVEPAFRLVVYRGSGRVASASASETSAPSLESSHSVQSQVVEEHLEIFLHLDAVVIHLGHAVLVGGETVHILSHKQGMMGCRGLPHRLWIGLWVIGLPPGAGPGHQDGVVLHPPSPADWM
ncbi:hypothetical protein F7725_028726, partial [Dissostichus mawsoni]